jgi:hypothetical protein
MSRRSFAASLGLAAMLMSANAFADVIVQNLGGPALGVETSGGPWDDVTFNFYSNVPPTIPAAIVTAFLLDEEYLGTPSNLSSSIPGFLAESTEIADSPASLPFISQPFTTPSFEITDFPTSLAFIGGVSANFTVSSAVSAAVPEPSTWAMMLAGFAGLGFASYRAAQRTAHLSPTVPLRNLAKPGEA